MFQYTIDKVTRLSGTDTVTAVLDLGFSVKTKVTFKLSRVETPEMDFFSESDPEFDLRSRVVQWFKTAPKPLYVNMVKSGKDYIGEVIDRNGNVLADDLSENSDNTQVVQYDYEKYAAVPATTGPALT